MDTESRLRSRPAADVIAILAFLETHGGESEIF